ncbi:hypothetical protein PDIG_28530 [Penicillium digitatum PHI26]|uniref:Uncharacterized protein n=2 Tax=Penicillium digitatum TaxID=36651 RepID=K9G2R4_PEND2|nr:hypothetical protein PDIP_62970 [Penicillium digitatum Pd1]EKV09803.1 hypothetical protein PDIP_62970 [Penicillium digitatum Pd1]EKV15172.1 hypothetical protein PDIG_28530 [Penicillium digitatum PHI26]
MGYARTSWLGTLRLRCLRGATVRWWSRGLERGRREEEKRRGRKVVGALLYPQEHAHLPKTHSCPGPTIFVCKVIVELCGERVCQDGKLIFIESASNINGVLFLAYAPGSRQDRVHQSIHTRKPPSNFHAPYICKI